MRREFDGADASEALIHAVREAIAKKTPLAIRGGDTKGFLGRPASGAPLDTRAHRGIVSYDPTELVVTARAGTPLAELETALDDAGQMLACEPLVFGPQATVGGMAAAGLSGARRPWAGSVRDFVLGCRVITGHGKHLRFGGEVMKNVAGFDVSRLLAGSFGCLGVITEVSLKVLPKPRAALDLTLEVPAADAIARVAEWRRTGLPLAGACHFDGKLQVRLEGGHGSVEAAQARIGGAVCDGSFWPALRRLKLPFFAGPAPLWRLSLPAAAPLAALPGPVLLDWAGMQRWLKSDAPAHEVRRLARELGGYATCFTPDVTSEPFEPLSAPLERLHRQLKAQLDPHGIFNPGRLYASL
ncbi:glycolate oxidase subunit GlcE [Trinickia caryophylli]|uniref:Glycolate oxidase FAD binding subunit n=1 Tax=Trinickia caryophylli TaxID=28094 RepID=A0A1X7EUX4_TRICW|nr:glycolate oxidase subunit GlcE [Trinickia caryophylli]PMS12175.1 glycolate oxidase subunit GlcE [Trinickia caryophylli]TRX18518.1 glycolate oxidase subunit GlcE [Trinickia caryophylli]WQE10692.1 glycolate oxidase subunit GlcE [Trinickia caryophylli]SMF40406.1 glycolate oxidase FAD binding subunit [Trinickia caryophylli]GLU33064.1 glycolate oxidase FAD binding subunit [Trinickia caryophylli]